MKIKSARWTQKQVQQLKRIRDERRQHRWARTIAAAKELTEIAEAEQTILRAAGHEPERLQPHLRPLQHVVLPAGWQLGQPPATLTPQKLLQRLHQRPRLR